MAPPRPRPAWCRWPAVALLLASIVAHGAAAFEIPEGRGSFAFRDERGDPSRVMTVYTYRPAGLDPATAPIVFVMHGVDKDADRYRDVWVEHAERGRFVVVAPLFDAGRWSDADYAHPALVERDGAPRDRALWSYSVVEHLFDAVRDALHDTTPTYDLYGHSEGAQFVHRLVLLLPDARYRRAIAANAGWYTMPSRGVAYPFGLGGAPVDDAALARSLGRGLVVLLGDRDVDPHHVHLNRSAGAMAQGDDRFDRGQAFYREAQARAVALGTPLGWRLRVVPDAAHQNSRMARAAAAVLAEP